MNTTQAKEIAEHLKTIAENTAIIALVRDKKISSAKYDMEAIEDTTNTAQIRIREIFESRTPAPAPVVVFPETALTPETIRLIALSIRYTLAHGLDETAKSNLAESLKKIEDEILFPAMPEPYRRLFEGGISPAQTLCVMYRNHKGSTRVRCILPVEIKFGTTQWHPEPQWLLYAKDTQDGNLVKGFALADCDFRIMPMRDSAPPAPDDALKSVRDEFLKKCIEEIGALNDRAEKARDARDDYTALMAQLQINGIKRALNVLNDIFKGSQTLARFQFDLSDCIA